MVLDNHAMVRLDAQDVVLNIRVYALGIPECQVVAGLLRSLFLPQGIEELNY